MNLKILNLICIALLSSFSFGQETKLFRMHDGKILAENVFSLVKTEVEENKGIVTLYDSIQRNDTIVYRVGIKPDYSKQPNPYRKFTEMIGDDFPLDLFGIETHGKPILVNFWFTSCPPCIKEIPDLNELEQKYKDQVDFVAITFNTKEQVDKFLERRPINFTHITDQKHSLKEYGIRSYPMNMLLDENGKILFVDGMLNYTKWEVEMLIDKEIN